MPKRFFEDFAAGQIFELPDVAVTREEIIEFSREFDPQIFHLRDETPITEFGGGGLIASGWHVCSLFMRLLVEGLLLDSSCAGSPGVEHLKWQHAVRPGDHLTGRTTVVETRLWHDGKLGLVRFHHEIFNQRRERTMMMDNAILFGRRSAA
jgi:acyl dehydratase